MNSLKYIIAMDAKQQLLFGVLCCTFILNFIEGMTSLQAAFGGGSIHDTTGNGTPSYICSHTWQ